MDKKATISEIVDNLGVTKYTWTVYFLVGLALLFDGFDYMIVAYTMPQMAKEWALTKIQTGSLSSWSVIGLIFGGVVSGLISDAFGRKKTLIGFVALYSVLTLPIYFATSFEMFAVLRVLCGIGIGSCIPIALTTMAEVAPTKNRGYFISSVMSFYVGGWVLAGIVAIYVVPTYGWRVCYLIGGLPLLYCLLLAFKLNESAHWLLGKGREKESLEVINKMEIAANRAPIERAPGCLIVPPAMKKVGVSAIFSPEYRKVTITIWILYFFGTLVVYGTAGWLPTLLVGKGYGLIKGYSFAILQNIFGMIGGLATGYMCDIVGRRKNVIFGWIITAAAVMLLGYSTNQWQVVVCSVLVGFSINWAISGTQPIMAEAYPTEFRNTGVAWAQAFGRVGGFIGPIGAGVIQQFGGGFTATFVYFAVPSVLAALVAYFFVVEKKGQSLDSISGIKA